MKIIYLFLVCVFSVNITEAQQFLTTINGLNAYVHLPDDYDQTTKKYPIIIFFPGLGDIGTDASKLLNFGPSKFVNEGHTMQFTVNGVLEKPIVISIQPKDAYPQPDYLDAIFNTVMSTWRIDANRFHVTGLSMGGFAPNNYVTQSSAYASRITSIVSMSAVVPNNPIANFANFVQSSGKWWGITGTNDERSITTIFNTCNNAVAGSAKRTYFTEGDGGHCCWNTFYNPSWRENGVSIYEWMLQNVKNISVVPGLRYRYFTFSVFWYSMPNLYALTPDATGTVANVSLDNRTQSDHFAYIWDGFINIPVAGDYTFNTTSDDGSQVWINGQPAPLVNNDNDGINVPTDKQGTITLPAGRYPVAFLYYERDGGQEMLVKWRTPTTGGNFVIIPDSAFTTAGLASPYINKKVPRYNVSQAKEVKERTLGIFPNPADEHVNLSLANEATGDVNIKVINVLGVVVKAMRYTKENFHWQQQLPVSDLKTGHYIIQVNGKNLNYQVPFIKK